MKTLPQHLAATASRTAAVATLAVAAIATLSATATEAQAAAVVVDVGGARSTNLLGESGNTVWLIDVGAHAALNALTWNVVLEAYAPSVLSEMQLSFGGSSGLDLVSFTPGDGNFASGIGSYSGSLVLSGLGLTVGADGLLRLEFSDAYKDFASGVDEGRWLRGTLSFDVGAASAVPEPASAALVLLGLAGLAGLAWRRGRASGPWRRPARPSCDAAPPAPRPA